MTTNLKGFLYRTFQQTAVSKLTNKHPVDIASYSSKYLTPGLGTEKPSDYSLMDCDENGEIDEHWSFSSTLKLENEDGDGVEGLISFEMRLTVESGADQIAQMEVFIRKLFNKSLPRFQYHFKKCYLRIELLNAEEQTVVQKEIDMIEQKEIENTPNFFSVWINCERAFLEEDLLKACRVVKEIQEDGSTTALEIVSARVQAVLDFGFPELLQYCMVNGESFQGPLPSETHKNQTNSEVPIVNNDLNDDLSYKSDSEDSDSSTFSNAETVYSSDSDSELPLVNNCDDDQHQQVQPNNNNNNINIV